MNRGWHRCCSGSHKIFPCTGSCIVFAGKGHNAGDALFAAQCLERCGWKIEVRLAFKEADCSDLMRKKLADLYRRPPEILGGRPSDMANAGLVATLVEISSDVTDQTETTQNRIAKQQCSGNVAPLVILDGLLGVGAKPPLREPIRAACRAINQLRTTKGAYVFAVDLPTGLDTDSGKADRDCVVADFTVTIGYPKPALVADGAPNYVGRLYRLMNCGRHKRNRKKLSPARQLFSGLLPRRNYNSYKNQFGRIGVIAGSKGFVGAALMASQSALRAGEILVEVFVPEEIYEIVAGAAFMEAMVKPIASYRDLLKEKADVWAVGPGLGKSHAAQILEFVEKMKQPMVLDADGLNIVSEKTSVLRRCKGKRLLTPHPGEMKRLFSEEQQSRAKTATKFCDRFPSHFSRRQSHHRRGTPSAVKLQHDGKPRHGYRRHGRCSHRSLRRFAGPGLSPYDAARVGAWLCGRAAEIAIFNGDQSEESLLPRDVLDHLGEAFKEL